MPQQALRRGPIAYTSRLRSRPARAVKAGTVFGESLPKKNGRRGKQDGASTRRSIQDLTPRELSILGMICDGDINREIALKLQLSADGVKYHLQKIFVKLGVSRRAHAIAVAIYAGLIAPVWLSSRSGGRH